MQLSPRMHLFLGEHVESLHASNTLSPTDDFILHEASVNLSLKGLHTKLRGLTLSGASRTDSCFQSFSWNRLEMVCLTCPSTAVISRLASLPQLETLRVNSFAVEDEGVHPPAILAPSGFQVLRNLGGYASSFSSIQHILRHLSLNTPLQTVTWAGLRPNLLLIESQSVLDTIGERCDPLILTSLELWVPIPSS